MTAHVPPADSTADPNADDGVSFAYDLTGRGWSKAKIEIGTASAEASASYLDDALGELLNAVRAILDGANEARASWTEEPGEFRWILSRSGTDANVRILWFNEIYSGYADERGKVHFDATCPLHRLAVAIASGAQRVLDVHGEQGYRDQWVEHDFPTEALRRIQQHLA